MLSELQMTMGLQRFHIEFFRQIYRQLIRMRCFLNMLSIVFALNYRPYIQCPGTKVALAPLTENSQGFFGSLEGFVRLPHLKIGLRKNRDRTDRRKD